VTGTTDTGSITFTGLLNGEYNVTIVSANYTPQNISFIPASGDNNEVDAYLLMLGHGYFNVTVLTTGGSPLGGATVTMRHNGTTSVDSRATGSDGIAIVSANTTLYSQNLSARATRSGYYDNETAQYTLSDQEIKDIVITLKAEPSSPYSPPGGGPSGSSIGGVVSETKDFGDIAANVAESAKFSLSDLHSIDEIEILTDQNANDVSVTVRQSGKPSGAPDPISSTDGKVQRYLEITATNLPDSIIRRVTITFKVSKTWVDNNGIDPNGMYMFRYSGGAWDRLSTSLLSEDDRWYYYRSTSPGFSIFAIGGYKMGLGRMELTMSTVSMKGNECRTAYISVKNTLSTTLTNLHVDPLQTECCTIEQLSGISSLAYGAQDSIAIQICSGTMTERGTYDYSMTVISDQAREAISSKIYVTESYVETLTRQIEELENRLAGLDMTQLNSTEMAYYDLALEKIEGSREYLRRQDFDGALTMLGEAREYFDKIQVGGPAEKGYIEMMLDWIMLNYILASVIGAIIVLALSGLFIKWKVISKQLPEMPDVPMPSGGEVVGAIKKSPAEIMDSIMAVVDELEARVDDMDIERLRESERKWYNKVKLQIEKIKKSVDSGDINKAKRNLNDAELFMKMLELNAAG
jgi:PGF-pre-PGF domain-containing protein